MSSTATPPPPPPSLIPGNSLMYGRDHLYLGRCTRWQFHDGSTIDVLTDDGMTVVHHLTHWQTFVYHSADGSTSLQDIIKQYRERLGESFEQEVTEAAAHLIFQLKCVEFYEKKDNVAEEHDLAIDGRY